MNLVYFVLGIVLLIIGASALVRGASRLALNLGVSPLVVGLTVVAFGTSAPEVAVSVGAALQGQPDIAVGNVVGSNIFNVLFILGVSALITPLLVNLQIIRQEVPIMIGVSILLLILGFDGKLGLTDSLLMMALMIAYTVFLVMQSRSVSVADQAEFSESMPDASPGSWDDKLWAQLLLIAFGLALLVLGSNWLVDAAVSFARALGISDVVIGLTIVAAGTSMPEVATSIAAALKGERDIAVGNVVGSNTFNILGCLGLTGLVSAGSGGAGLPMSASVMNFDIWVMLAVALACVPVALSGREIARWEGAVFVFYYAAYAVYLILNAQGHDALAPYSRVMMSFVLPITVITLVVALFARRKEAETSLPASSPPRG